MSTPHRLGPKLRSDTRRPVEWEDGERLPLLTTVDVTPPQLPYTDLTRDSWCSFVPPFVILNFTGRHPTYLRTNVTRPHLLHPLPLLLAIPFKTSLNDVTVRSERNPSLLTQSHVQFPVFGVPLFQSQTSSSTDYVTSRSLKSGLLPDGSTSLIGTVLLSLSSLAYGSCLTTGVMVRTVRR